MTTSRRTWRAMLAVFLIGALLAACGDDTSRDAGGGGLSDLLEEDAGAEPGGGGSGGPSPDEAGEWTIFVYLAADNDLEPFALQDLDEMTRATGVEMIVLLDRSPGYTSADAIGLGDFDDTRLVRVADGEVELLEVYDDLNTGHRDTLADFVANGLTNYGSERNGLIIWNHGAGWPGAAIDETSMYMLSLEGIREGVQAGLDRAGVDRLDLIGFDACLMATYEVAHNLSGVSRTLLASEELEPGHGWDWSTFQAPDGSVSTIDLARGVIEGFAEHSTTLRTSGVTLSLVDLDRLDAIDEAFVAMAEAVDPQSRGLIGRIGSGRAEAIGFGRDPDPSRDYHLVDIGHLAELLTPIEEMNGPASQLRSAIDEAVLLNITDATTAPATGLAVYFPPIAALGDERYEELSGNEAWTGFLNAYYTGAEEVPSDELPAFLDEDRLLEDEDVERSTDGITFTVDVVAGTGVNVVSSKLFWGQVDLADTNLVAFFGERLATIDGDSITASYDWRYLVIEDGTNEASAYSQLDLDEDGSIRRIVVPLTYTSGGTDARGILVLGIEGDRIASETFYRYTDDGTVGEIDPQPGDTFVPQLLVQNMEDLSSEWLDSTETPLSADPERLEHHMRRLDRLTPVMLELNLTDIEGGNDYLFHGTASP